MEMEPLLVIFILILILLIVWGGWYIFSDSSGGNTGSTGDTGGEYILPVIPTPGPGYTLQFINMTTETIILGVQGPTLPVSPREPTPIPNEKWTIPSKSHITLDVPEEWMGPGQSVAPRFWARTGCRYDAETGYAQCESGSCNLNYDCTLGGKAPASLAEFCFNCGQYGDEVVYDVSLVDGYNLSINIIPIGGSSSDPHNPNNDHWNVTGLCKTNGADLRSSCPEDYQLTSEDLSSYIPGSPDNIVACFSNCGKSAYPNIPSPDDPEYADWQKYCCQYPAPPCATNEDCNDATVCWSSNNQNNTCQCHGWIIGATCAPNVCTFQSQQPPFSQCTDCVGDDTFHTVCPYAYSWPNENQNMNSNAKIYQIVFGQGTTVPITPVSSIPACTSLPSQFDPSTNISACGTNLGPYSGAHKTTDTPPQWDCSVSLTGNTTGVLCSNIVS